MTAVEEYTRKLEKGLELITATQHVYAHPLATMQSTSLESLGEQTQFDLCTYTSVSHKNFYC